MLKLTEIQYNVIMQAINNAKNEIAEDTFIDPYGEIPEGYNNDSLSKALHEVEEKLINTNTPI